MEVSVKCEARHICIRLSGELDHHSAKGLLRRLDQEIEKALPTQLTLDLSGVTFMDSSGIALLIRARQMSAVPQHRPAECWMRRGSNVI